MSGIFVIIAAAGCGSRVSGCCLLPKQFRNYHGKIVLRSVVETFAKLNDIDKIVCVVSDDSVDVYKEIFADFLDEKLLEPVIGGERRQDSVRNALNAIAKYEPDYVLIHDAARININEEVIELVINALKNGKKAVIPGIEPVDSVRISSEPVDRKDVILVQTPQGFDFKTIHELHNTHKDMNATDDAMLCSIDGIDVEVVKGDIKNQKLTYSEDFAPKNRVGLGVDVHAFSSDENRKLFLMGVFIDGYRGLDGFSDADVAVHSIVDAILGALGKGSIGEHFSSLDSKFKNYDSKEFLKYCHDLLFECGYYIVNCDVTIICEEPRIVEYSNLMKKTVSECLNINENLLNVKGKTTENLGFIGRKEGIAACCSILLERLYS
ncbi:bifunctional enzyme IspD/IspF [Alphaproteobacteria bacterium]|nr:bifunctional enzyme IspD/IspF [Alphaproteobacteria bacterium]